MNQKQIRIIVDIIIIILFAIVGIIVGLLISSNSNLRTELINANTRSTPTVYATTIKTSPPKIIIKYRNGYQHINDDPLWNCVGNWYNAYIRLANGGPAGDSSLWNYYCPGIQEPAN